MNENNLEENLNDKRLDIMMMKEDIDCNSVRIGDKAPCFHANTTMGPMKLSDYMGKWVILFSHPGDFTPVLSILLNVYICKISLICEYLYNFYTVLLCIKIILIQLYIHNF